MEKLLSMNVTLSSYYSLELFVVYLWFAPSLFKYDGAFSILQMQNCALAWEWEIIVIWRKIRMGYQSEKVFLKVQQRSIYWQMKIFSWIRMIVGWQRKIVNWQWNIVSCKGILEQRQLLVNYDGQYWQSEKDNTAVLSVKNLRLAFTGHDW